MTSIDRRTFLRVTGAAAGTALFAEGAGAAAEEVPGAHDNSIGVLYDATRCIGCRSCVRACREENALEPERGEYEGVEYDMPSALSAENWTVIKVQKDDRPEAASESGEPPWSFVKLNCMHCNVPACASACPVAALEKTDSGPVLYHEDRCIGCRYCLMACPFQVPRYEWVDRMPRVRKCNWNRACVRACPVDALTEGRRADLVEEAHRRIDAEPDRYIDHVYGEHEAGGTSQLILAGLKHRELGLPVLPPTVRSHYADTIMKGLPGWIIGLGLFLGGLHQMEKRQRHVAAKSDVADAGARSKE